MKKLMLLITLFVATLQAEEGWLLEGVKILEVSTANQGYVVNGYRLASWEPPPFNVTDWLDFWQDRLEFDREKLCLRRVVAKVEGKTVPICYLVTSIQPKQKWPSRMTTKPLNFMVGPVGLEPTTKGL